MASSFGRQRSWHERNWVWSIPLRLSWPVSCTAARHLPARLEADTKRIAEGRVECASIKRRLLELPQRFTDAAAAVDESLAVLAGTPGDPASFAPLDELLEAQAYRLCFWRVASDEINYRRFFDINDLAALTTEREDVFLAIHRTWLGWVATGLADGLRIDHPDGLFDPEAVPGAAAGALSRAGPGRNEPLYVVVEKILGDGEAYRPTGSATAPPATSSFTRSTVCSSTRTAKGRSTAFYHQFTGCDEPWPELVYRASARYLQGSLTSELNVLAYQLDRLARSTAASATSRSTASARPARSRRLFPGLSLVCRSARFTTRTNPWIGQGHALGVPPQPAARPAMFDFIRDTVLLKDSPERSGDGGIPRPAAGVRGQVPAGHVAGDGEGGGGHRVLRLQPAGFAQRGRRRAGAVRLARRRRSTRIFRSARRCPAGCRRSPPTTPSAARTCGPASTCCPKCRPNGASM